jgi:hypothetical protein
MAAQRGYISLNVAGEEPRDNLAPQTDGVLAYGAAAGDVATLRPLRTDQTGALVITGSVGIDSVVSMVGEVDLTTNAQLESILDQLRSVTRVLLDLTRTLAPLPAAMAQLSSLIRELAEASLKQ